MVSGYSRVDHYQLSPKFYPESNVPLLNRPFDTRVGIFPYPLENSCMGNGKRVKVSAVGDLFLNRKRPETAFELVEPGLSDADLLVGNYEASFSDDGERAKFRPWSNFLYSPTRMVAGLTEAGFNVVSLANNQSMNYGPEGLLDTVEVLSKNQIGVVGAGINRNDAEQAYSCTINGIDIGILGFESTWWDWKATQASRTRAGINQISISPYYGDPYVNDHDLEQMKAGIEEAADANDVLLTLFHFGIAGEHQHTVTQTELAYRAIESGADAVIGAHSHTLQAIEVYQSAPIFYSLGNFAFDRPSTWSLDLMPSESGLVDLSIDRDGISDAIFKPAVYDYGTQNKPKLLSPDSEDYTEIVDLLIQLSKRAGTELEPIKKGIRVPLQ